MRNILRILKRDILRLLKAPAALIVVGALMVLPSLYTWYNVLAFWNPYEATDNLTVGVVNQDAGTETKLTGTLNVGSKVVEELLANDKLHFVEQDFEHAMDNLRVGGVFAVYVLPEDFSECLVSPLSGQVKSPHIVYYANEKLGPVSPKITDTAANTLNQTINSTFVATIGEAASQAIDKTLDNSLASKTNAQNKASTDIETALAALANVRANLQDAQTALDDATSKTESASSSLEEIRTLVQDTKTLASSTTNEAATVSNALAQAADSTVASLSGVSAQLSQVITRADTVANGLLADAGSARTLIDTGTGRIQPLVDTLSGTAQELQAVVDRLSDSSNVKAGIQDSANNLAGRATELQSILDTISALGTKTEDIAQEAVNATATLDGVSGQLSNSLTGYSDTLFAQAAPAVTSILGQITATSARLDTAASDLETAVDQAQVALGQLDSLLATCDNALGQTDLLVSSIQDDLNTIVSDIRLLAQSETITNFVESGSLNPENIGEFMGSPTKLETVKLYHPNAYGTAMAPLFMNLTFWIGAFMLVIIFRTEVDDEDIKNITLGQRYLSRFALFAGISIVQAIICCVGVLALGVQVSNVPALFIGAAVAALAYLSIIYALSTTLQHVGKALCIILVFAQIPGGSGLYPLELTDGFFQAIYPFLPFSYGIDALREAIGGFYGYFFARDLAMLGAIFITMIVLGIVLCPAMSNVTRMAAHQICEGNLYNGEDVAVPERPYRLAQVIRVLSDKEEFRENLAFRYERFSKLYPLFIRGSIVLAIGVPAVLAVMLALDAGEKVVLLTIVLLWLVALLVFVLVVESLRNSFERQLHLDHLTHDGALKLLFSRERLVPAFAGIQHHFSHAEKTGADEVSAGAVEKAGGADAVTPSEPTDDADAVTLTKAADDTNDAEASDDADAVTPSEPTDDADAVPIKTEGDQDA